MTMLKKNAGIVTLVGIAARLVTRASIIATIARIQKAIKFPDNTIENMVIGVMTHP